MQTQTQEATRVPDQVSLLRLALDNLSAKDKSFAESLCNQFDRGRALSTKQVYWVGKLLEKASRPAPGPAVQVSVANIIELFQNARGHLRYPAIVLLTQEQARPEERELIRFSIAGAEARFPGSINITSYEKDQMTGRRDFLGRIHKDGRLELHESCEQARGARVIEVVQKFAADPAGVASRHGKLTGLCCFCHKALTDERSTTVGYGKVCAGHWRMPWGSTEGHPFDCTAGEE